jgi:hypothetical protein
MLGSETVETLVFLRTTLTKTEKALKMACDMVNALNALAKSGMAVTPEFFLEAAEDR